MDFHSLPILSSLFFSGLILFGLWSLYLHRKKNELETIRKEFIVNVSHEFRTPLSVMKGYLETLLTQNLPPEKMRPFLLVTEAHTERLVRMVEDILKISRLEKFNPKKTTELVDLAIFFDSVTNRFSEKMKTRGISCKIALTTPLQRIETDAGILDLIFNNLIDNAIKSMEKSGIILIEGKRKGLTIQFSVQDEGIGIPLEIQKRVFERFYQGNRREKPAGTGLGLSIVKHAVSSLGGKIRIESSPGAGSKFIFTIKEG